MKSRRSPRRLLEDIRPMVMAILMAVAGFLMVEGILVWFPNAFEAVASMPWPAYWFLAVVVLILRALTRRAPPAGE